MKILCTLQLAAALLMGGAGWAVPPPADSPSVVWIGPDGPLPFTSLSEVEEFLAGARIYKVKPISVGITRPLKVGLVRDGIRMNAVFRYVNIYKQRWNSPEGTRLNFRDSFYYERASYCLARMLEIDHVPPAVLRHLTPEDFETPELMAEFPSLEGSLQAWVENAMTEVDRKQRSVMPPSTLDWMYQQRLMWLFDNLIFNDDRNQGNILIGPDWKIWFIDATRAFRPFKQLLRPKQVDLVDRRVFEKLQSITDQQLRDELAGVLRDSEIDHLLARREALLEHIHKLIQKRGESRVLVSSTRRVDAPAAVAAGMQNP